MAAESAAHHDRDRIYRERFESRLRAHLRTLITPALIEEHRASPLGQHSDDLERVLNYFRRGSLKPGYALHELEPDRAYRVVVAPERAGELPEDLDGTVYGSQSEALHALFLRRVDALMTSDS